MDVWKDGWKDGMDGRLDGWMDGWMDGRLGGFWMYSLVKPLAWLNFPQAQFVVLCCLLFVVAG